MRVGLYVRVSTQEQAKEGYSVGEQTERLQDYAKAMRWQVHKTYVDPGYSGGNTDRPALQALMKDVEAGLIEKVVVYKLDRLSRSQLDTLYLIEKVFLSHGCDFVSMSENFDTSTPFGRAMIGILAVFAQLEREQIKERMGMGKEARAKEGKWGGGSSEPIGYDYDPLTEELYINEYEKMQIEEAVELFMKGTPLRTICNLFHNKGYTYRGKSGRVSEWDPKRLKYVFANKLYLGYMKHNDEWYKGSHTPIMTEETFEKLQNLLAMRKEKYAGHTKKCMTQTTYLGGMLFCKQCGARYTKQDGKKRKDGTKPRYYCCYSRNGKVPKMIKNPNCKNKNWRMEELDKVVMDEIRKLSLDPEYKNQVRENKNKKSETLNKIEILQAEIKKLDDQISRFMDLYGIGKFTIEQVSQKVDPLNEQRRGLEQEIASITAEANTLSDEEVTEILSTVEEIFERGKLNEIRLVISSLIYYVEVDNEDVYIHWKFA